MLKGGGLWKCAAFQRESKAQQSCGLSSLLRAEQSCGATAGMLVDSWHAGRQLACGATAGMRGDSWPAGRQLACLLVDCASETCHEPGCVEHLLSMSTRPPVACV
eukprot:364690-Chlamydomonas_euryale.AAC.15